MIYSCDAIKSQSPIAKRQSVSESALGVILVAIWISHITNWRGSSIYKWAPMDSSFNVIYNAITVHRAGAVAWSSNHGSTLIAICDGVSGPEILYAMFNTQWVGCIRGHFMYGLVCMSMKLSIVGKHQL